MRKKEHLLNYLSLNQAKANKAAQDYNNRYNPLKQGLRKGLTDLTLTDNGCVSFKDSPYIYKINTVPVYKKIKATGSRSKDFKQANELCGFSKRPSGYTWHHLDDYSVIDGTITLELVESWAHRVTTPHSGGCAMYKAATSRRYK